MAVVEKLFYSSEFDHLTSILSVAASRPQKGWETVE